MAVETAMQRTIEVATITTARRDLSTEGEPSSRAYAVHLSIYDASVGG
jgi:hypothetical protein